MKPNISEQLTEIRDVQAGIFQWQKDHERHDDKRFFEQKKAIENLPSKDEVKEIVEEVLIAFFKNNGGIIYKFVISAAAFVLALGALGVGFKWLLGLAGFFKIN